MALRGIRIAEAGVRFSLGPPQNIMDKKITFIPGWMYSADYFKLGEGINVWKDEVNFEQKIECEYLAGHSMGAAVALKLWRSNKDKKLILVDPFIERKNILRTAFDWLNFYIKEGSKYDEYYLGHKYLPRNIKKVFKFPDEDYWDILKNIQKDRVKILHGVNDLYLCGNEVCDKLRNLGLEVIEIPEAGHDWHKNFDDAIMEIVNS